MNTRVEKIKALGPNPGRIEIHKALGTWHFDKDSDKVDYEYFGRIEMPNSWWMDGIANNIEQAPVHVTSTNLITNISTQAPDVGQEAFITDLTNSEFPADDTWFERFTIEHHSVFHDINNFFEISNPVIRTTNQKPYQAVPLHIDHEHAQALQGEENQFEHSMDIEKACGSRGNAKKFLIAMHDFPEGVIVCFGNSIVPQLKQGDVISWKYGTPHWTVNFSDSDRYMLGIIGTIDKQFYLDKFDFDYEDDDSYPTPVFEAV